MKCERNSSQRSTSATPENWRDFASFTGTEYWTQWGDEPPHFEDESMAPPVDRERIRAALSAGDDEADEAAIEDSKVVLVDLRCRYASWARACLEEQIDHLIACGADWKDVSRILNLPPRPVIAHRSNEP